MLSPPQRMTCKLFFSGNTTPTADGFVKIFHRWIRERSVGEQLIDVHNYGHIYQGPGVVLVAHEAHYRVDGARGRPGLLYARKRGLSGSAAQRFERVLACTLEAAVQLEGDTELDVVFEPRELEVRIEDRLIAPNDEATAHEVEELLRPGLQRVFGNVTVERQDIDARDALTLMVRSESAETLSQLLGRLDRTGGES